MSAPVSIQADNSHMRITYFFFPQRLFPTPPPPSSQPRPLSDPTPCHMRKPFGLSITPPILSSLSPSDPVDGCTYVVPAGLGLHSPFPVPRSPSATTTTILCPLSFPLPACFTAGSLCRWSLRKKKVVTRFKPLQAACVRGVSTASIR